MSYLDTPEQAAVSTRKVTRLIVSACNRVIWYETEQKFPFNVNCKTFLQLAWPTVGKYYSHRLLNMLRPADVARTLNSHNWLMSGLTLGVLNRFICSAAAKISEEHISDPNDYKGLQLGKILLPSLSDDDFLLSETGGEKNDVV